MILHIDMDAYFASVEQLDNPDLKGKPVIICGQSKRSVVSTASYEARVFGVHSAMPYFKAKKLCPDGIFIKGRMSRYKGLSIQIFDLLDAFSPLVEPVSIDEAYLDITGCEKVIGTPEEAAVNIKKRIFEITGLTCSIGIAPLKFLSKIASDMNKPAGITIIKKDNVINFIETLDIEKVPGVGKTTYKNLEMLSVKKLGDIKKIPEALLIKKLGKQGKRLKHLANGIDNSKVTARYERKSISAENTLPEDTLDQEIIRQYILMQADDIARQLRRKGVKSKTIVLKITFSDFNKISRRVTLQKPVTSSRVIYQEALKLIEKENIIKKIRLVGVGCTSLSSESMLYQGTLFDKKDETSENWEKAEKAVDSILNKFGKSSVKRATFK